MTYEERSVLEDFALRHANRVNFEAWLEGDIFERIKQGRLTRKDKDFLLYHAEQEEQELIEIKRRGIDSEHHRGKIERLLKNAIEAKRLLTAR